jgi:hypothetical protein
VSDSRAYTDEQRKILAEVARRGERVRSLDWEKHMFGPQRAFILDKSRLKAACCGRRSGKSHGVALSLLKAGFEYPGTYPIYINLNRASAKGIIWPALRAIDKQHNLGLTFNNTHGHIYLPNESAIMVYGAGSRREMDKMRGLSPPAVCLDEAQNMGQDMMYLLTEVLLPATFDHKAPIMVTGTPANSRHNPFYSLCHSDGDIGDMGWSLHHWTMLDNPFIPDAAEQMEVLRKAMKWGPNEPAYLREMLGLWVFDTKYRIFEDRNDMVVYRWPKEKANDWRFILGVDLGTHDPCAFTVLTYSRQLGATYVLESYKKQLTVLQAGTEIERLMHRYPVFSHIVVDSGGQGASFVMQWKDTHPHIPARPVQKGRDSVEMGIAIINADIRAGKIFFVMPACVELLQELETLQWDERAEAVGKRAIKSGMEDHSMDSFRYAYTKVRTHDVNAFEIDDSLESPDEALNRRMADLRAQELRGGTPEPFWVKVGRWKRRGRV